MRTQPFLLSLGCWVLISGCALHGTSGGGDSGTNGNPTFVFDNCNSTCGLDQNSVAAGGAHTTIVVGTHFSGVRSTNPAVATFTANANKVEVESGIPGTTELQILDGAGRLIDSATVTVAATAQLRVNKGWSGTAPLVLEGETLSFHVTTLDANSRITKGDGAVHFTLGGTLKPAIAVVDGDAIAFTGTAGAGTIDASCPDAAVTQAITVVPASAVTQLATTSQVTPNDQAVVTVVPQSASGNVYSGPCAWQTSDSSVTLEAEVKPTLDLGAGTVAVFNLYRPGTFTITCTTAGQSASVTVTR